MTNPLATMPAAELLAHKMRAAWPKRPMVDALKVHPDLAHIIAGSVAILAIPPDEVPAFTGSETPF